MGQLERVFDAQEALRDALAAELEGVPVDLGYPYDMRPEHVWVSCNSGTEVRPLDSGMATFNSTPSIGGGITVQQYAGSDWTALRARLREIEGTVETTIAADRTLGGTCTGAHIARLTTSEQIDGGQVGLLCYFELDMQQYGD